MSSNNDEDDHEVCSAGDDTSGSDNDPSDEDVPATNSSRVLRSANKRSNESASTPDFSPRRQRPRLKSRVPLFPSADGGTPGSGVAVEKIDASSGGKQKPSSSFKVVKPVSSVQTRARKESAAAASVSFDATIACNAIEMEKEGQCHRSLVFLLVV